MLSVTIWPETMMSKMISIFHGPKWRRQLARYEKIVLKSKPRRDGHGYHCSKLGWIKTLIFLSAITIMSEIKLQI
jgi:hypothetical protein